MNKFELEERIDELKKGFEFNISNLEIAYNNHKDNLAIEIVVDDFDITVSPIRKESIYSSMAGIVFGLGIMEGLSELLHSIDFDIKNEDQKNE